MKIEQGKLSIRNATAQDAQQLQTWWNDGAIMAHAGYPNGLGISVEKIVEQLSFDNDRKRRLIIELEGHPIGEMSYRTPVENTAEIGIKICDASQRNKGYGSIYLKMLMAYLFTDLNYGRIILDTNLENERAQHVYEKLGFTRLRINRNAWKDQSGQMQSSVDYEMTREAYLELFREESS
jgi:RimJ/RimL family protein N-acetyltransferase